MLGEERERSGNQLLPLAGIFTLWPTLKVLKLRVQAALWCRSSYAKLQFQCQPQETKARRRLETISLDRLSRTLVRCTFIMFCASTLIYLLCCFLSFVYRVFALPLFLCLRPAVGVSSVSGLGPWRNAIESHECYKSEWRMGGWEGILGWHPTGRRKHIK